MQCPILSDYTLYEMVNKDDRATFWQIRTIFTRLKSTKKSTKKVQMVHDINFKANSSFIEDNNLGSYLLTIKFHNYKKLVTLVS